MLHNHLLLAWRVLWRRPFFTATSSYANVASSAQSPASEPQPGPVAVHPRSETILLVEDEDAVRSLARRVLQRQGYRVLEAQDGSEALMISEQFQLPIHLLLTDVVMPGMDGFEAARLEEDVAGRARRGRRLGGDSGVPLVLSDADAPASVTLREIATRLGRRERGLLGKSLSLTPNRG